MKRRQLTPVLSLLLSLYYHKIANFMHSKITCQLLPLPHKSGWRSWDLKTNNLGWTSLPFIWLLSIRFVEVTFLNGFFCDHGGFIKNKRLSCSRRLPEPASLHKITWFRVKSSHSIAFKLLLLKRQLGNIGFCGTFLRKYVQETFWDEQGETDKVE